MLLLKSIISILLLINLSLLNLAHAQDDSDDSYFSSDTSVLTTNQGYLLIDLDVGGVAPSIMLVDKWGEERKISLKNRDKGLNIIPFLTGDYQITHVNAPYYDLPFELNTSTKKNWSFSIEEGKITYVGKLIIKKERSERFVDIRILNRIASDYESILKTYPNLTAKYHLVASQGIRDDFLVEFEK